MKIYRNYEYTVLQMPMGHLCGYVKVPEGHPYYGEDYDSMDINCHGGLTYATMHTGEPDIRITEKNNFEKYFSKGFWIGFDYAHSGDWEFYSRVRDFNEKYNTLHQPEEVEQECKSVIDQLITLSHPKDSPVEECKHLRTTEPRNGQGRDATLVTCLDCNREVDKSFYYLNHPKSSPVEEEECRCECHDISHSLECIHNMHNSSHSKGKGKDE